MKFNVSLFYWIVFTLLFFSFVSAQSSIGEQVEEAAGNLEKNVTAVREFTESQRSEFLGTQWKEFLLKSKLIAGIDAFFVKINLVFVVLLGMDWSLSMQMYFAFLFWLVVFYSMLRFKIFTKNKLFRWLYFISIIILLPMTQIYEAVGGLFVKLVFYKNYNSWKLISWIILTFTFVVLGIISNNISSWYKKRLENKAKKIEGENREELEKVVKATRS